MHVLHLDEQRTWRGGEQQASWLIRGLVASGHEVTIVARPESAFIQSDHGGLSIKRIAMALRSEFDVWSAWRIAKIVNDSGVDILHAHTSHAHSIACIARVLAGTGKVVVSRRVGFTPKDNPINRWKYKLPDKFISVSEMVNHVLAEFGVAESKREMVYSSIDLRTLDVEPLTRSELGVPESAPLLVSAGALVGHKDIHNLVSAIPAVLQAYPDAQLLIAGEGELRGTIEQHIEDLGLVESVALLGHRTDVPRLVRAADVYVSSSWSEGLGTSLLEALGCQVPVVATVAGGVPEMVINGETGYLVPNRDSNALSASIIEALGNPEKAREMAKNGRRLVEDKFIVERMVEGTLRVYESLCNQ